VRFIHFLIIQKETTMAKKLKSGLAIATAAAALLSTGLLATPAQAAGQDGGVKCSGVNSCKGTSECKTAHNACKGQNSCKGHGWVTKKSADECTKAGGKVVN
jgi:hypothetical protein